ncbi:hypothetical protein ACF087_34000 [Streptomyces goshikiensis]|uniref:hypothetical protein n=1 Tax=Streptomyces goshikiensis TaxID=1942 RepID=UPI0036F8F59B
MSRFRRRGGVLRCGRRVASVVRPRPHHRQDLHNGASNNGTTALHQQVIFRPTPGAGRPEAPVRGLYLASAAAHPRGGVHGAPGRTPPGRALRRHGLHALLHHAQRV